MAIQRYYLDTSALIARYLVRAPGHVWVHNVCDPHNGNTLILAQITGAEIGAAFNQLARSGAMRKKLTDASIAAFWTQVSAGEFVLVPISIDVVQRASNLCGTHPLKGYDAVQLACAIVAREDARLADAATSASGGQPLGDPIFLTEDHKLRDAAAAEGFVVDSPIAHP